MRDTLAEKIDDHALEAVPIGDRKSWVSLTWNTAGIVTTLIILFFGALVCFAAGVRIAILAGFLSFLFGTTIGWLLARIAVVTGHSNTLITREFGLGERGSAIASIIFGLLIIGMLALENALLYRGVLFFFGLEDTLSASISVYGLLTIAWIALTTFGFNLVSRFSSLMLTGFLLVIAWMLFRIFEDTGVSVRDAVSFASVLPVSTLASMGITSDADKLVFAFNILVGPACALPLVAVDYGRYARSTLHAGTATTIGNFVQLLVVPLLGGVLVFAAQEGLIQSFINEQGLTEEAAAARVLSSPYNVAAAFMLFGGTAGFVLMFIAQSKAQVLNCYSGSLALANLVDATFAWRPGRFIFVIAANVIALGMLYGHLLELVEAWITMLGVLLASLSCLIIADYYIVRPFLERRGIDPAPGALNLAGVLTLGTAIVIARYLLAAIQPVEAVTAVIIVLTLYPALRYFEVVLFRRRNTRS
jgi:cytosine permease